MLRSIYCLCICLLVTGTAQADIVFFDGEFADADWTQEVNDSAGTGTSQQLLNGGNPNAFRESVATITFSGTYYWTYHFNSDFVYTPSTDGLINDLSWSMDVKATANSTGVAWIPILRQNGSVYSLSGWGGFMGTPTSAWTPFEKTGLTSGDVYEFFNDPGPQTADFSASGSRMEFGYWLYVGTTTAGQGHSIGVDNYSVTLNTVPEPASGMLFGLVGVGIFANRRRHSV